MAATYDPATDAGRVRTLIGDMNPDSAHFDDAAITSFLDIEAGDVRMAAASALEAWAAQLSAQAHDITLGDYREDLSAMGREMRLTAKGMREAAALSPAFAIAVTPWDGPLGIAAGDILANRALMGEL